MATRTRERMIETAARLLQHRGYHGTSLNDVLAESGAPRGSLYFHFPGGKDELVREATRAKVAQVTEFLQEALARARSPATAVRRFFEESARLLAESEFTFGCPVAPVVLDAPEEAQEIDRLCREAFEEWAALYREAFIAAGIPRRRAETLAMLVESTHEGLMLIARAQRNVGPMIRVAKELEAMISAAIEAGDAK